MITAYSILFYVLVGEAVVCFILIVLLLAGTLDKLCDYWINRRQP